MILDQHGKPIRRAPPAAAAARGWEAGRTDQLNADHWRRAHGQPLNFDLLTDLKNLRDRCEYEVQNNAVVEGVVNTYSWDVVGEMGPIHQVQSDDEKYNTALEDVFAEWWACPHGQRA
ncbi:MAG: hypothetical protein ACRC1K_21640 [Planctomycetia bacterium]